MKKSVIAIICTLALIQPAFADFKEHFDLGQQYLSNYQYSGAVTEFKNALRINYLDNSARIGLINSYLARGAYYANNEKNWQKAADDYRSALFYMLYYPTTEQAKSSSQGIAPVTNNLNRCLSVLKFDTSPKSRFETAKQLRAEGNFAAAAYEFNQSLGDKDLIKDSYEQVGDIMRLLGNDPKAAEYYRKAISVSPTDINLRLTYAKLLDKLDKEEAAVDEYNYILTKSSDNKDVLYSLERIYKKKLEASPSDSDLTSNLGAILQKQGKLDEALIYYKKAEQLDPSNINTRINVGTLYQQKEDYKTAIVAYDSVLILYPDNLNANIYKAQCLSALGNGKEAQAAYKKVLALDPSNAEAQSGIFESAKKSMTVPQYIEYVKKNSNGQDMTGMLYNYGLELHKENKLDDAITIYNELLKSDTTGEIYINLAIAQNQKGNYDNAINTLNTAKVKFPNNSQIATTMTSIKEEALNNKLAKAAEFYNNKQYEKAIAEYLKIQPATVDSMLGTASAYQNMNDNANAIEYYKKALALKPTDSEIAYYIGALYADDERYSDAEVYLQKALTLNKNNTQASELLAQIQEQNKANALNEAIALYDAQKYDESLAMLNKILETDKNNVYGLYYRGMIYDSQKKLNEAINDFKQVLSLNANDFLILNYMIAADYDTLEKYKDAYQYYEIYANSNAPDDEYKQYSKTRMEELKQYVK